MTYEVYIDDRLLFYPNDEKYVITDGTVELSLNESGTFQFNIPKINPEYDSLENQIRSAMVQVKQNGTEIFYGEVREVTQNFNMTKHVYCVGELAFLFDSIQPQAMYNTSPFEMFKSLINQHNTQVEARKQFKVGSVTVTDSNNKVYRYTNYEDTLTVLRTDLCDSLKGYLRIRKVNNVRYLDLVRLEDYGKYCTQEIQFGENLLNYAASTSGTEIATAVIPLGTKLDEDKRTSAAVNNLDEKLTIVSVNNGKNYVFNQSAVNKFGWVKVVKEWSDVTDANNLKKKAEEWLKSVQFETLTLEVSAFDQNILDINVDAFNVGDTVHAWALPYGMDTTFPIYKKTININDFSKNSITLGSTANKSYTSQASAATMKLSEEIPQTSPILQSAKDNATSMITNALGGYVVMNDTNGDGHPDEILIMNNADKSKATKVWRWNSAGLGYSNNGYNGTYGLAMTMDGSIVADYITSGKLKVAGSSSDKADKSYIEVYNGSTMIGSWSKDGIDVKQGSINLGNGNFVVDNNGNIALKQGSINLGNGTFTVDNAGNMVCFNAGIRGYVEAQSGVIGSANDNWEIGQKSIKSKGMQETAVNNAIYNSKGTYVGTDGIVCGDGQHHVWIGDGQVTGNGSFYGKSATFTDSLVTNNVNIQDSTGVYQGQNTKTFVVQAYVDGVQKAVGLTFKNGILVGKSDNV